MKLEEAKLVSGVVKMLHPSTTLSPYSVVPLTKQSFSQEQDIDYDKVKSKINSKFSLKKVNDFEEIKLELDDNHIKDIDLKNFNLKAKKEKRDELKRIFRESWQSRDKWED